ncbi:MAG: LacI family DNA-binding transcriptional regulator [Spirochaetota bacterium]
MKQKINSIEDIARIAGVSKSTVSRSLNDSPLISDRTKNRIIKIAREHNFHINQAARSLNTKRSGVIALAMPIGSRGDYLVSDPFTQKLLATLVHSLNSHGYDLLFVNVTENGEWINRYGDSRRVDGFLVLPCGYFSTYLGMLTEREYPFVVISKMLDGVNFVSADDRRGGYLAAEHLIQCGARRIAFIGGPRRETEVVLRLEGFRSALEENAGLFDELHVVYGKYLPESGYECMKELFGKDTKIDGVFACSDRIARGVLDALVEKERKIPDDVSLVGYDNTIAQYTIPTLTTIHQDIEMLGRESVRILLANLDNGDSEQRVLPVELIHGGSSR